MESFMFGDKNIYIILDSNNNPWFKGKEVAVILGYKDVKQVLQDKVSVNYKKNLKELCGGENHLHLSYNELKCIFISEPGLYELIFSSKLVIAKKIKQWVFEEVLPEIRKKGEYKLKQDLVNTTRQLSVEFEEKLKIKENEIKKLESKNLRIKMFVDTTTMKNSKDEWIYIATTDQYAQRNLFKIGSTTRLSKRIGAYQTGRVKEDKYYYVWVEKCYNSKDLDKHIQHLLYYFKQKNTEMYNIHFDDLIEIIEFIIENYDKSVEFIMKFIKERLENSFSKEPKQLEPLIIKEDDDKLNNKHDDKLNNKMDDNLNNKMDDNLNDKHDNKLNNNVIDKVTSISYKINDNIQQINIENIDQDIVKSKLFDLIEIFRRENKKEIKKKELIDNLEISNMKKPHLWAQVKELVKWKDSKTSISFNDYKFKIIY